MGSKTIVNDNFLRKERHDDVVIVGNAAAYLSLLISLIEDAEVVVTVPKCPTKGARDIRMEFSCLVPENQYQVWNLLTIADMSKKAEEQRRQNESNEDNPPMPEVQ